MKTIIGAAVLALGLAGVNAGVAAADTQPIGIDPASIASVEHHGSHHGTGRAGDSPRRPVRMCPMMGG